MLSLPGVELVEVFLEVAGIFGKTSGTLRHMSPCSNNGQ